MTNSGINAILQELERTPSKKAKEELIRDQQSNLLFRMVLMYALDPFVTFGIRKIPAPGGLNDIFGEKELTVDLLPQILEPLRKREVTGNAAIDHVRGWITALNTEDSELLIKIIKKDLRAGFAASTVNKAFGEQMIPQYAVMLASPLDEKIRASLKFPMIAQTKSDGMRFNAVVMEGKVKYFSRQGQELELHGSLDADFLSFGLDRMVFDGELLVVVDGRILPRAEGNGILNKANKGTISPEEANTVHARIWDMIPVDAFFEGVYAIPYWSRWEAVSQLSTEKVNPIFTQTVNSWEEANDLFQGHLQSGEEGIMLKTLHGPWEDKRSKHNIKLKDTKEAEFRVCGWIEGTGKYVGKLGAIKVTDASGTVISDVGTGFSDADRESITPDVVGSIITVKYNEVISRKDTYTRSLFLPRFAGIRTDKFEADSL